MDSNVYCIYYYLLVKGGRVVEVHNVGDTFNIHIEYVQKHNMLDWSFREVTSTKIRTWHLILSSRDKR